MPHGRQNSKIRRVTREHGSSDSFTGWNSKDYLGGSNSITCHLSGAQNESVEHKQTA